MKIKKTMILLIIIIICLCVVHNGIKKNTICLSFDGLNKIEIWETPVKSDGSNISVITKENEMKEYINILNTIKVYDTDKFFQEAPNTSIKIYYNDGVSYLLEFNRFAGSKALLKIRVVENNGTESSSKFFLTDEIYRLLIK